MNRVIPQIGVVFKGCCCEGCEGGGGVEQEVASGGRHGGAQCHQQLQQPSTIIAKNSPHTYLIY